MSEQHNHNGPIRTTCCPCGCGHSQDGSHITRRGFLHGVGGAAAMGAALTGLTWAGVAAAEADESGPGRKPILVKPILVYNIPQRAEMRSWRNWGGVQTAAHAEEELGRIRGELAAIEREADFPVEMMTPTGVRSRADLGGVDGLDKADVYLIYAAGGSMDVFDELGKRGKDVIIFCRHKSGPVYLWYEIISPRYLRQHTDTLAVKGVNENDVVIDSQDEILWRLRALCGLKNTMGTRIIAIGGPAAWAQPKGVVPKLVEDIWKFDIRTCDYKELGKLIKAAKADAAALKRAKSRARDYMAGPDVTVETKRSFVENAFLLEQVFRGMMKEADCQAITINGCMGTIMPMAETSACLTLTLLNDVGFMAFCESDFVVIPSGVLMVNISGKPMFFNDPTYPHDGVITLAHCTGPRKMDGRKAEPVRILTHFESDYGAAPKVQMTNGQVVTNIIPDFASKRWVGLRGEIIDSPFMDICRCQIDIRFDADSLLLAKKMPGFHWMTCYGDYMKEIGYALRKVGIEWDTLDA